MATFIKHYKYSGHLPENRFDFWRWHTSRGFSLVLFNHCFMVAW